MLPVINSHEQHFPWAMFSRLIQTSEIWDVQVEDGYPPPDRVDWERLGRDPNKHIFLFGGDNTPLGFTMLTKRSALSAEAHASFLEMARGRTAHLCGLYTLTYGYHQLGYRKFRAECPAAFASARHYVTGLGFSREGISPKTFLRNGTLLDTVIFGLTEERFHEKWSAISPTIQ